MVSLQARNALISASRSPAKIMLSSSKRWGIRAKKNCSHHRREFRLQGQQQPAGWPQLLWR